MNSSCLHQYITFPECIEKLFEDCLDIVNSDLTNLGLSTVELVLHEKRNINQDGYNKVCTKYGLQFYDVYKFMTIILFFVSGLLTPNSVILTKIIMIHQTNRWSLSQMQKHPKSKAE